ncbi:MAG: hypothetical protein ABIK51_04995 [candidate division WOR-3 bacterium]
MHMLTLVLVVCSAAGRLIACLIPRSRSGWMQWEERDSSTALGMTEGGRGMQWEERDSSTALGRTEEDELAFRLEGQKRGTLWRGVGRDSSTALGMTERGYGEKGFRSGAEWRVFSDSGMNCGLRLTLFQR